MWHGIKSWNNSLVLLYIFYALNGQLERKMVKDEAVFIGLFQKI